MPKAPVSILGLLIVLLTGCMSAEIASLPTVDVNGTWTGSLATGAATYTMVLSQSGEIVKGNLIRLKEASGYGNTPPLTVRGDQITGIVRGTTLTLRRVP